jgi:hypothetical protein
MDSRQAFRAFPNEDLMLCYFDGEVHFEKNECIYALRRIRHENAQRAYYNKK